MTSFADSSALVKLYADEVESEHVRSDPGPLIVSVLARVEVPGAIWRKYRTGDLALEDAHALTRQFEDDLYGTREQDERFLQVECGQQVRDRAADLIEVHGLRAYDAVQLASAITARGIDDSCTKFWCFDTKLGDAASVEGFNGPVVPNQAGNETTSQQAPHTKP